jgi:hypothetical protein
LSFQTKILQTFLISLYHAHHTTCSSWAERHTPIRSAIILQVRLLIDRGDLRLNPSSTPTQVSHHSAAPFLIMEGIQKNPQTVCLVRLLPENFWIARSCRWSHIFTRTS